jgi:SAM-dependent methyltransferase
MTSMRGVAPADPRAAIAADWVRRLGGLLQMGTLSNFVAANRRISRSLTPTHVHEANVFGGYRKLGAMLLSHPDVHRVLDVGGGKTWHFPPHYKEWYGINLIGLDIDAAEMEPNQLLDEKIECDVVESIPIEPDSVDLVMVHSGIEHFHDNQRFLRNAFAALRPGGFLLAQFPNRYAPFAVANRLLPKQVTRRLLDAAMGNAAKELGFQAYYDRTHYSGFRRMFESAGFKELYYSPGFYSSDYFAFFVPFFMLSYAFDALRFATGIKNLASYNLWVLQKPDPMKVNGSDHPFRFYAWE